MIGSHGASEGRVLTLTVNHEHFTVPAAIVREVARLPRLSRVPHAPPALAGLANIRGAVVPVLSLAALVERAPGHERRVVIVDIGEVLGLAVDEATSLLEGDVSTAGASRPLDIPAMVARCMPTRKVGASHRAASSPEDEVADRTERVPLVVFTVGAQEFAFSLGVAEEVLRAPELIASMPLADPAVIGSTAVRGELLPLLSLRALLALTGTDDLATARVLVVRIGAHRVGLLVDAMRSIVQVAESDIDPLPQVLHRHGGEARIQAIARLDEGARLVSVLAAEQLVRDDIFVRLAHGAEDRPNMAVATSDEVFEQFLLFRIGEESFGLPIGAVDQVTLLPEKLTRLPKAPAFIEGLMNLRGTAIPIIDQATRFGRDAAAGRRRRVIIVRIGDLIAGFVVDAVSDVIRVSSSELRAAPDLGSDETRVFDRVAQLEDGQLVLIVSPREMINRAEQDLLRGFVAKSATAAS